MTDPAPEIPVPLPTDYTVGEGGHTAHHNKLGYLLNQQESRAGVISLASVDSVGNGVADDLAYVNSVIATANALGISRVAAPPGKVYGVSNTVIMKSNVTLDGVSFKDLTGNRSIINTSDCVNFTIKDCHFTGSGTLGTAGRGAIWGSMGTTTGPTRGRIVDNVIDVVGTCGIAIDNAADVMVGGNTIRRSVEHGVYVSTGSTDVDVYHNHIISPGYGGIDTVEGVKIAGTATRVHVSENIITDSFSDGICFESAVTDCSARDNTVRGSGADSAYAGIRVNAGASKIDIIDNTILPNAHGASIRALGGDSIRIVGNKMRNAVAGCIVVDSGTTNVTVAENTFEQTGGFYSIDLTVTTAQVRGNVAKSTGTDSGFIIRATSTGVTVNGDNVQPAGITNSAGSGAVLKGSLGTVVAATTPGSVVSKMTVYNANGTAVGFVPVYSTIT